MIPDEIRNIADVLVVRQNNGEDDITAARILRACADLFEEIQKFPDWDERKRSQGIYEALIKLEALQL